MNRFASTAQASKPQTLCTGLGQVVDKSAKRDA